jgi:hypothetical protein
LWIFPIALNQVQPPDALIMQGQALVQHLRRVPLRRIAELGDSAERVLLTVVKLDVLLSEEKALVDDDSRGPQTTGPIPTSGSAQPSGMPVARSHVS